MSHATKHGRICRSRFLAASLAAGITLAAMLETLVERHGWEALASKIRINCFANDPSVKSSLKFLRKNQWARDKVEQLYLSTSFD